MAHNRQVSDVGSFSSNSTGQGSGLVTPEITQRGFVPSPVIGSASTSRSEQPADNTASKKPALSRKSQFGEMLEE
jgi:hypothetical protein